MPVTSRCLALAALLACSGSVPAQTFSLADAGRPEAVARAAEFLASGEQTRALGGRDQAMAALIDYEQAAAWASQGRAPELFARARLGKSLALGDLERPGEALSSLEEAVATARAARLRELLVELLDREAALAESMGLVDQAVRAVREAALLRDELGDVEGAVEAFLRLADLERSRDGGRAAAPALQAALERARGAGLTSALDTALEDQVELSLSLDDSAGARQAAEELLDLRAQQGDESGGGSALVLLGRSLVAGGESSDALPLLEDAARVCADAGDKACESDARELLAATLLELGRPRQAVQVVLALVASRRSLGDRAGELRAHLALARAFGQLGGVDSALASLAEAERLGETDTPPVVRASLLIDKARLLARARRILEATAAWDEALALMSGPDDARRWPEMPALILAVPEREAVVRERLDFLVGAGLWARALSSCEACRGEDGLGEASLDALRELALTQGATYLTWRALDDSLLGWALTPDGRLLGARVDGLGDRTLADLAAQVRELAPRVEVPGPEQGSGVEGEALRRALRRLHDALIGPLEPALPEAGGALLLAAPPALRDLPWGLLVEPDGGFLGQRFGLAELAEGLAPPRRPATPRLRVLADLRDPEHPGMDVRRLVARLDGEARRRAEEAAAEAAPISEESSRSRSRTSPGRRRAPPPPLPTPPEPFPPSGERRFDGNLVVLAGASGLAGRLAALAPDTAVLVLLADCEEFEAPELDGALVALPACHGASGEAAARALLAAGARAVLHPRWDPGAAATEAFAAGWVASIDLETSPARALSAASEAGLPTSVWGSLRLIGAAR